MPAGRSRRLRAFDAYRRLLAEEVGVDPTAALRALNDDILRQHPDVAWGRPASSAVVDVPAGTVSFLFTDIEGSTRLWQEHRDAMTDALARHDGLLARCGRGAPGSGGQDDG